jgi:hypothetical protein
MTVSAWGQAFTATISGVVEDATDAYIVNATVKLISTDRGIETIAKTNSSGSFSFPGLLPGHFELQVERDGFDTTQLTGITLTVDERKELIVRMQVGRASQTIEVSGSGPALDPTSSSVSQLYDEQAVRNLPLNTRNFAQLIALAGNAVPDNSQTQGTPSISGGRGNESDVVNGLGSYGNNYRLDGLDNLDNHNMVATFVFPPVDAIQEFRLISNTSNAEFGTIGATINTVYKTGTRKLHGDVFEFLRNSKYLDAKNYFDPAGPIIPFHFNNYGFTLGGPVIFPHFNPNHDKLFFFSSWDGTRTSQSVTSVSTVPQAGFVNGNFSAYPYTIYDPLTTAVSPTGTISRTAFPGNQIPTSRFNQAGLNLLKLFPAPQNAAISNNYTYVGAATNNHDYIDERLDSPVTAQDSIFLRVSHQKTSLYQPGSLPAPAIGNSGDYINSYPVWQVAVGYTRSVTPNIINEAHAGFGHLFVANTMNSDNGKNISDEVGIPGANIPGNAATTGLTEISLGNYGKLGDYQYANASWADNTYQFNDSVTWVLGHHTVKFGGQFIRRQENIFETNPIRGLLSFGPTYSTDPAASGSTGNSIADLLLGAPTSGSLALQLGRAGLRRSEEGLFVQDTWQVNRRFTVNAGLRWDYLPLYHEVKNRMAYFENQAGGIYNVGTSQIPWSTGVEPRYDDFGPRVGFTYAVTSKTLVRSGFGIYYGSSNTEEGYLNPPYAGSTAYTNSASNFAGAQTISDGFTRPTILSPLGAALHGIDPYMKTQTADQFNFNVQQTLPGSMLLTLGYVGTLGRHLGAGGGVGGALALNGDPITPGPGSTASREPYPQYGTISISASPGSSSYNSLQAELEKSFTKYVQFKAAYTWSHALDDVAAPQNPSNLAGEYGNGASNVPQKFVFAGVFALPVGRGMRFGAGMSPVLNAVIGGWQLSTITNFFSGLPFTPTSSVNTLNNGGTQRPNRTGSGLPAQGQQTINHWFNTSAFAAPAQYQYGNSGRDILRGPDTKYSDVSLFKTFKVGERDLTFRGDTFNITNTPQFNNPAAAIGSATAGVISSAGSPVSFQRISREIQLSVKLLF